MNLRVRDLRKRLMIKFRGEEGLDYGGVAREWLYLLSHEMLNPYYGLFQYSREDIYTLEVSPNSSINPDHISYFYFVGRIVGMAIFHGHYIDAGFTLPFYKQLLGRKCTVEDMENVDPAFYKSMKWILENDVSSIFDDLVSCQTLYRNWNFFDNVKKHWDNCVLYVIKFSFLRRHSQSTTNRLVDTVNTSYYLVERSNELQKLTRKSTWTCTSSGG